jgi:carboxyl-terminal processing protease
MKKITDASIWTPLFIALAFIGGILCDNLLKRGSSLTETEKKFRNILNLIENEYVDEVNTDSLIESIIPDLFAALDPHSLYIPAEDLQAVNDELEGSFCGIGIQFTLNNDTITVVESLANGPSERVGIVAGDRIIAVDDENVAGVGITNEDVLSKLRGDNGTVVTLTIKRRNTKKPITFKVERAEIPYNTVDAAYIASPGIGYLNVNRFGKNTYDEFWQALNQLRKKGAEKYIIDLRGNTGGYMEMAVLMINEFMPKGTPIVYTAGRRSEDDSHILSDGEGSFQKSKVVVLIDEISASASEIFAGAIQDNDRGLILGRRSFGKGLVQRQIDLPDNSAIRLTVARYYTPSGRCIQKDYTDSEAYENDLIYRYNHGETLEADSIHFDPSLAHLTMHGRTVYGGGGIMPDIFIPNDTSGITKYYLRVNNAGLLHKFALEYVDNLRPQLEKAKTISELEQKLPTDFELLNQFVRFATRNGERAQWYYIDHSADLIVSQLKALIADNVLGRAAMLEVLNQTDPNVIKAIEILNSSKSNFPIHPE